jgi:hypothetical protein
MRCRLWTATNKDYPHHFMHKKKPISKKSRFDPTRNTVGSIYVDLHKKTPSDYIQIGDMNREMLKGFLEDINEAMLTDPFNGKPFYIRIVEEKDLQMKDAIHRGLTKMPYRPWPEDNTTVFWVNPRNKEIRFCWDIPHHSEFAMIFQHAKDYPKEYITGMIAWQKGMMDYFGFEFIGDYQKWDQLVQAHAHVFVKEDIKLSEVEKGLKEQIKQAGGWFPKEKQNDRVTK